ncbi:P-loop NTPase fold protein [Flammeovirgaceae bacterium SG7u.111]|nr:P-loop NTPase fold protein [Flammeovirgaceae bacterium SG7u.132]WPO37463.1 P-loop NTPase fold protein [Flammeovirgaceae bacterium SG7u.111]
MAEEYIELKEEHERFGKHLEENNRIFFSGIFGIGKTHFLRSFFDKRKDAIVAIRLSPVSYSVSRNEDIFELIKTDILLQLLAQEVEVQETALSKVNAAILFAQQSIGSFLSPSIMTATAIAGAGSVLSGEPTGALMAGILKVGPTISKSIDGFLGLKEKLAENYKKVNEDQIGKEKVWDFIKEQLKQKGSPYESDPITILIQDLVVQLKEKGVKKEKDIVEEEEIKEKNGKEVVLYIDDLDRIDPAHIFRILNVFSVHIDEELFHGGENGLSNKFGFDKIILVGDIQNVRNIFHHQYGQETDFSGYIDKFYDGEVFRYDPIKEIIGWLYLKLQMIKSPDNYPRSFGFNTLHFILKAFLQYDLINLRKLLELLKYKGIDDFNFYVPPDTDRVNDYYLSGLSFCYMSQVLRLLFGSKEILINTAEKLKYKSRFTKKDSDSKLLLEYYLTLVLLESDNAKEKFDPDDNSRFNINLEIHAL